MTDIMQIETEQREVAPLQRQGQLETDTFCDACGYNLHGQPVARDPHLGIMVCRCPECGGWHAAGKATASASLWLARLATLALALWVLIILFAVFWLCIGLGVVQVVHVEEFSYRHWVADDGREVVWDNVVGRGTMMVYQGTTQPAMNYHLVRRLERPSDMSPRSEQWHRQQLIIGSIALTISNLGLGVVSGILLVTFFWYWKKQRYRLVLLLPFAVAGVVLGVMLMQEEYAQIKGWMISRVTMHAAMQALFMYLGILIGRPVVRGLLRMFIPPKPRQVFAFLWRADGKAMPGALAAA